LVSLLDIYLSGQTQKHDLKEVTALPEPAAPEKPRTAPSVETVLKDLVETYAVSGHEANMRKAVTQLLPPWAKPETDAAGNLILRLPSSSSNRAQHIAVVAHMDEIGYEVGSILPDGRLELASKGGGILAYFLGHAALVHSANGIHPGVLELPEGWEKPDFQWPHGQGQRYRMDVGARSSEQVAGLGINPGDFVTVPKQYHKLLGTRSSARSLDDRVGCAALVLAAWTLSENMNSRQPANSDITFIWSTREELGLEGAAAVAKDMAAQGRMPTFVFAIDTFVSADSPLESERFGEAILGRGFVVRAVDNSNIVPRELVDRVISMARSYRIPGQYGVTGGGNDGATFLLYGATDVAIGWPLRYSHSPAEVIDVRDLDALSKIIAVVARNW
jgi:putative aminopeptidase FrvX